MTKKKEIGLRLKEYAINNYNSISDLSKQLGMNNRQQIYDYINGKSFIGSELLIKLINLGCDINWLLTGIESSSDGNELFHQAKITGANYVREINAKYNSFNKDVSGNILRLEMENKLLKSELKKINDILNKLLNKLKEDF